MIYGVAFPAPSEGGAAAPVPAGERIARSLPPSERQFTGLLPELSENDIQRAVFIHLRTRGAPGIFAFHPKNASADMAGRKAGIHVGLGVEPGIPDVIVFKPQRFAQLSPPHIFALELKTLARGRKKENAHEIKQRETRERMRVCGVIVGLAYGLDEALAWLEQNGLLIGRSA